jgi:hypothetical protein
MTTPRIGYNKENTLRVCELKNRNNKILPLVNGQNRVLPIPVKFLQSFVIRKAAQDKVGRVIFNYYPVIRDYPYLSQLIGEGLLYYPYRTVDELLHFLEELECYLYKINDVFDHLESEYFPALAHLRNRFNAEVQEGRTPYTIKLIKPFFRR